MFKDKNGLVTRAIFQAARHQGASERDRRKPGLDRANANYCRYRDLLIVHKIQSMLLFACVDCNGNVIPVALAMHTNTIIDDYLWTFKQFLAMNNNLFPTVVVADYDENLSNACDLMFVGCKIVYSPWSISQLARDMFQNLKTGSLGSMDELMGLVFQTEQQAFDPQFSRFIEAAVKDQSLKGMVIEFENNK